MRRGNKNQVSIQSYAVVPLDASQPVTMADVERARMRAKDIVISPRYVVRNATVLSYAVNRDQEVADPVGLQGEELAVTMRIDLARA